MTNFTSTRTTNTGFYTSHLTALLAYLKTDGDLAETFAHHVQEQWPASHTSTTTAPQVSPYLIPTTREDAVLTANWLLQTLPPLTSRDARSAVAVAQAWAQNYQEPKAVVLGVVGVAIIGPTLGLIKSRKRRKGAMRVVVTDSHFASLGKKELAKFVAEHTGAQLATELKLAGGNAMQLHPDTFDWTFSDHAVNLFTHDVDGLKDSIATLTDDNLPHTVINESGQIIGVVVSPIVDETFVNHCGAKVVK